MIDLFIVYINYIYCSFFISYIYIILYREYNNKYNKIKRMSTGLKVDANLSA